MHVIKLCKRLRNQLVNVNDDVEVGVVICNGPGHSRSTRYIEQVITSTALLRARCQRPRMEDITNLLGKRKKDHGQLQDRETNLT